MTCCIVIRILLLSSLLLYRLIWRLRCTIYIGCLVVFDQVPPKEPTIGVLDGCLCFSYSYRETYFVIWKMKEFGVENSWTQFLKISYQNLHIDYDFNDGTTKDHHQLCFCILEIICEFKNLLILSSINHSLMRTCLLL
jgi:hypothetical protein